MKCQIFYSRSFVFLNVQGAIENLEYSIVNGDPSTNSPSPGAGRFATTHWSVVLAAGEPDSTRHRQALEALCRTYWFPLYVYLRRQGNDAGQAEDYTQAFLAFLLEKQALSKADPKRGRFRSFLLASLKNFLANERARAAALKRGGGRKVLSLDIENAERRYALKPVDESFGIKLEDHLKIVAYIRIGIGSLFLAGAVFLLLICAVPGLAAGDSKATAILIGSGAVLALIPLVSAAWDLAGGIGILKRRRWARIVALIGAVPELFVLPVGTAIGIYTIWVLMQEETVRLFKDDPAPA